VFLGNGLGVRWGRLAWARGPTTSHEIRTVRTTERGKKSGEERLKVGASRAKCHITRRRGMAKEEGSENGNHPKKVGGRGI
jgi:hypothetical protein